MAAPIIIPTDALHAFVVQIFEKHDIPTADAARVANCLVEADLRGVAPHGVRCPPICAERLWPDLVKARPRIEVERALTVGAYIDADDTFGWLVMAEAIAIAREHGIGITFIRRSTHKAWLRAT